jgi:hypothetical protein
MASKLDTRFNAWFQASAFAGMELSEAGREQLRADWESRQREGGGTPGHAPILAADRPPSLLDLRADAIIDLAAAADGSKKRPTFQIHAYSGDLMKIEGYWLPIVIDLAGLSARDATPVVLNHDETAIVGQATKTVISKAGIDLSGNITGENDATKEVLSQAANDFQWQASVGVGVSPEPGSLQSIGENTSVQVNGKNLKGPLYVVRKGRLGHVSFVGAGADESSWTRIAAKAAALENSEMASQPNAVADPLVDAATLERQRVVEISKIAAGFPEILEPAIQAGWSVEVTASAVNALKLRELRTSRGQFSGIRTGRPAGGSKPREVLAAALLLRAGFSTAAEKLIGERPTEEAHGLRCHSLVDICQAALTLSAQDIPHERNEMIRAAFSTSGLSVAVGDAAAKIALESYRESPASWRSFAKVVPLNNFLEAKLVRVLFGGEYQVVGAGGELKHGHLNEDVFTIRADTAGMLLGITRQDVINDNLQMLAGAAQAQGRAGVRYISDVVFDLLLRNKAPDGTDFFSEANNNLHAGAETALSYVALCNAIAKMAAMTDGEGRNIDVRAKTLLAPVELDADARQIINSQMLQRYVASGTDQQPQGNALIGQLTPVSEPRLSNPRFTGHSPSAWYLFSAPVDGAVTVGFVGGVENPVVEQFDQPPDSLGLLYRGYIDFGVALSDPRATKKFTGESE